MPGGAAGAGRHPTIRQTPLERKLDLLEARFTGNMANNNSQHTTTSSTGFGFDTTAGPSSSLLSHPTLPAHSRSMTSPSSKGLHQLQQATERHLEKVAGKVVVWASDTSNTSANTRVADNRVAATAPAAESEILPPEGQLAAAKKRKSVPVKRTEPSVKENVANSLSTTTHSKGASRDAVRHTKRGRSKSPGKAALSSSSLQQQPSSRTTPLSPTRSREAPDAKRGRHKAPLHNASIMQFFAPLGAKKTKAASKEFTNHENNNNSSSTTTALASPLTPPPRVSLTPTVRRPLQSPTPPLERLERRVRELEQQCHDKDEQLKAVSNNRTILHTALQSALVQRQKELVTLQTERKAWEGKSRAALETLVRDRATTEAKDVRERLAADGARLGRIVHSRAGMRVVETWEEGYASVQLQARRQALRERKILLQERYEKAAKIAKRMDEVEDGNANDGEEADMAVGGVHVRTALDASEAKESARFHLQTLLLDEKKLATEESSLKEEQGAHVRALKRVASEDASRFKARPKLHDRYLLKHLLGKGGFSEVWRAYDLMELREVAVKIHQLDPRWSDSKKENFTKHVSREYEIHRNVRHPRIVSLFDVFEIDNNSFATVLECCDGSDLDTLLKTRRSLTERDARAILLQILSGMRYLNQPSEDGSHQGIIHYDLKPGNILFDEFGDAKITDFGLSKIVDAVDSNGGMELTSQGAGTYWYLPPECFMLDDNVRISNKVDVWSIGVIFYQMLFGRRPFGDGQSQDAILADGTVLNAHQVSFPEKVSVSEECKDFLRTCLTYDQSFRPTVSQLCSQSYVLSKDFSSK